MFPPFVSFHFQSKRQNSLVNTEQVRAVVKMHGLQKHHTSLSGKQKPFFGSRVLYSANKRTGTVTEF